MAVFLLLPDVKPLPELLVLRRAAVPAPLNGRDIKARWAGSEPRLLWVLFVVSVLYTNISNGWPYYKHTYIDPQIPPIHGLFEMVSD
jgi:hypothetical protein